MKDETKIVKNICDTACKEFSEINIAYVRKEISKLEYIQFYQNKFDSLVEFSGRDLTPTARKELRKVMQLCIKNIEAVQKVG